MIPGSRRPSMAVHAICRSRVARPSGLRTNRAQVRYWVWFAASAKFLIPFSLLVGLGTLMPHPAAAPPIRTEWVAALQEFSQPLTLPTVAAPAAVTAA